MRLITELVFPPITQMGKQMMDKEGWGGECWGGDCNQSCCLLVTEGIQQMSLSYSENAG